MAGLIFSTPHLTDRAEGDRTRKPADLLVGDAPDDADEALASVKAPAPWIRALVILAATAALWLLIIAGCVAAFAHIR